MMVVRQSANAQKTPGRVAIVEAVQALVGGDLSAADAAIRRLRIVTGEAFAVEADTLDAWLLRARGQIAEAVERLESASGRILVEDRILSEDVRRPRVA